MARLLRPSSNSVPVFSEEGRLCPSCGVLKERCTCREATRKDARPATDGIARVRREKSGRGGKTVTTISGVPGSAEELAALARRLKTRCGTGGAVKDWVIEIQGDRVDELLELLEAEGFKARRAGG